MKILKFGAIWCKECLVMRPRWAEIEKEIPELVTEYFDADENPDILERYNVKDIPAFIFLDKDDKELLRLKGTIEKDELMKVIKENINK